MARRHFFMSCFISLLFISLLPLMVQAQDGWSSIVFMAYDCSFDRSGGDVQVNAILMGADGRAVPRETYRLNVSSTETGQGVSPADVRVTSLSERPPLRMVIVLDITDTVPLLEIKTALANELMPRLQLEDQVALITFGSGVSETTSFLRDKNRLMNDYILDLQNQRGDNRIYNGLLQAVTELSNLPSDMRQVVLILTDSGRRTNEQAAIQEIIDIAALNSIQVYPIGYFTRDTPDVEGLTQIADATGGFSWMYMDPENTRASVQTAVEGFLADFVTTLNSEILVDIESPVESPTNPGLALYSMALALRGGGILTEDIGCPIEQLQHQINFTTLDFNRVTNDAFDISVSFETELDANEVRVAFLVDDAPVQTSSSQVFTFDTPSIQPGIHTIFAQLLDTNGKLLASTPQSVTVYAQQKLRVEIVEGSFSRLDQPITLEVFASPQIALPEVVINIYEPGSNIPYRIETFSVVNGIGRFTIRNMQQRILEFLPEAADGDLVQISIEAPAASPSDPPLASPVTLPFSFDAPEEVEPPRPLPAWLRALISLGKRPRELMGLITLGLFLFNIILFVRVRRLRIIKLINHPDDIELSDRLMTVTIRDEEGKKSFPLTKKTMTIGRGDTNDIDLGGSASISRRHGVIIWRKGQWWYSNRKHNVQVTFEGQTLKGYGLRPLIPITEIEFGDTILIFHSSAQQDVSALFSTDLD